MWRKRMIGLLCVAVALRGFVALDAPARMADFFRTLAASPAVATSALAFELGDTPIPSDGFLELLATPEEAEDAPLAAWTFTPHATPKTSYPIKTISINPRTESGYTTLGNIYVKNDSTKTLDLKALVDAPLPFKLAGNGPHVLVHTHGSEAYFPEGKDTYTPDDVERTLDKNYNMIRVGDELEKQLKEAGISVIHDRNIYDSPSYNGSYNRTLKAITAQLKKTPSIQVVIDLHRDAMTAKDGVKYRTAAKVDGKNATQLMIVMSSGESGLSHPNWQENLKLALKLQGRLADKYPGLMRPLHLRKERFNMHATKGSMLIEVGTSANALSEALIAMRPLATELADVLK